MIVRTVLGDIAPGELGVTYAHEHLIIDSPTVERAWPHIHLPSMDDAIAEMKLCRAAGVDSVVDAMPTAVGRNIEKLIGVARATGINVVAATGMHTPKYYPGIGWADDGPDDLAERFIGEILDDADRSGGRAGIMKVATTTPSPTPRELALFRAAGLVHGATDVPILTHCEAGEGALEQIDLLASAGVEPSRLLISHTDKCGERRYHRDILATGANVEYDQSLRQHLIGEDDTAQLIADMWEEGFGAQILLGTDGARRSLWKTHGGEPGLAWLRGGFPGKLRPLGIGDAEIAAMFVENPARVLTFSPPR